MRIRFTAVVASAAAAMVLLAGCGDDGGSTTLASGEDVELVGDEDIGGQTLDISAEEQDGEVTGEIRFTDPSGEVVVAVECADTETDDVVILGEVAVTPAQVTMLTDWVIAGGNLIAMRPNEALYPLLGLLPEPAGTLGDGRVGVDTHGNVNVYVAAAKRPVGVDELPDDVTAAQVDVLEGDEPERDQRRVAVEGAPERPSVRVRDPDDVASHGVARIGDVAAVDPEVSLPHPIRAFFINSGCTHYKSG